MSRFFRYIPYNAIFCRFLQRVYNFLTYPRLVLRICYNKRCLNKKVYNNNKKTSPTSTQNTKFVLGRPITQNEVMFQSHHKKCRNHTKTLIEKLYEKIQFIKKKITISNLHHRNYPRRQVVHLSRRGKPKHNFNSH